MAVVKTWFLQSSHESRRYNNALARAGKHGVELSAPQRKDGCSHEKRSGELMKFKPREAKSRTLGKSSKSSPESEHLLTPIHGARSPHLFQQAPGEVQPRQPKTPTIREMNEDSIEDTTAGPDSWQRMSLLNGRKASRGYCHADGTPSLTRIHGRPLLSIAQRRHIDLDGCEETTIHTSRVRKQQPFH